MRYWLGAHDVSAKHLWSVARVRGITASVLAIALGVWILRHQHELFLTDEWEPLYSLINGHVNYVAWPILIGGGLGVLGLFLRTRLISLASCAICIAWFGAAVAFLGYTNGTDTPSVEAFFAIYGLLEYAYRFVLLAARPKPGEDYGEGW